MVHQLIQNFELSKMIHSGGILGELLVALPYAAIKVEMQQLLQRAPELTRNTTRFFK